MKNEDILDTIGKKEDTGNYKGVEKKVVGYWLPRIRMVERLEDMVAGEKREVEQE